MTSPFLLLGPVVLGGVDDFSRLEDAPLASLDVVHETSQQCQQRKSLEKNQKS